MEVKNKHEKYKDFLTRKQLAEQSLIPTSLKALYILILRRLLNLKPSISGRILFLMTMDVLLLN